MILGLVMYLRAVVLSLWEVLFDKVGTYQFLDLSGV
jgi:hypothetical protein